MISQLLPKLREAALSRLSQSDYALLVIAALSSVVVSLITFSHQQPFNVDGIMYLESSTAYLEAGIAAAMDVYPWPLYSIAIATVSQITQLSLLHSAYVLTMVLGAITVVGVVLLTKELGGGRSQQYLALLLVLIFPYFTDSRGDLVRGHGYAAAAIFAMIFLIRYSGTAKISTPFTGSDL